MNKTTYLGREAVELENAELILTVTQEGGHVARLLHKDTGINPLWTPHWPSMEPSRYSPESCPKYGDNKEAKLLAGLLGHSLCFDLFGSPSSHEKRAGIPVHGEASVATYEIEGTDDSISLRTYLPMAQLTFERRLELCPGGVIHFREIVRNDGSTDRPIGWTQHVTLGGDFLRKGKTRLLLDAARSRVIDASFNAGLGTQLPDAEFLWPLCPRRDGGFDDLSVWTEQEHSAGFTAHQMNPSSKHASFAAWDPQSRVTVGYVWHRTDFPWLARWEENHLRPWAPWSGDGYALGMEFGVSPFVQDRRGMVELGLLFDTPTYAWLGAGELKQVEYVAFVRQCDAEPSAICWDGKRNVSLLHDHERNNDFPTGLPDDQT